MRVLLTVHQFVPEQVGGTEILTLHTAQELGRRGHEVTVLAGFDEKTSVPESQRFESLVHDGVDVLRYRHVEAPTSLQRSPVEAEYRNLLVARELRERFARRRPDVVHAFHLNRLSASVIDVCHELRVPIVATPTDFWLICVTSQLRLPDGSICEGPDAVGLNCLRHAIERHYTPSIQKKVRAAPNWLLRLLIAGARRRVLPTAVVAENAQALIRRTDYMRERVNRFDRLLIPTRFMRDVFVRNGVDPKLVEVVPYGVNVTVARDGADRGSKRELRIGFIGAIVDFKGVHLLVEAVRSLEGLPIDLQIYGKLEANPDYAARLRALAAGDSRVRFLGTFPNAEIGRVIAGMDALALPSTWHENTPLVVYSAQAAACPVIATNLGGIAEVVHDGVNGLLFEKGDVAGIASAIRRLHDDRALLRKLSAASKVPRTIAQYVDDLERVYERVAPRRP